MSKHRGFVVGSLLLVGAWGAACSAGDPPFANPDGGTQDAAASDADAAAPVPDTGTTDTGTDGGPVVCPGGPTVAPEQIVFTSDWKMAELAVFVAPVGSGDISPMLNSLAKMFGPDHAQDNTWNVLKPVTAHTGYGTEVSSGIVKGGFVAATGCIPFSAITAPSGIIVSMSVVPSATAPSVLLPDLGTAGPSVSGSIVQIDADLYIDGVLVDADFDSNYPPAINVYPLPDGGWNQVPGWSHILLNFGENQAFSSGTLKKGEWEFRIKLSGSTLKTIDSIKFWVL